jgi:hypothetical protein
MYSLLACQCSGKRSKKKEDVVEDDGAWQNRAAVASVELSTLWALPSARRMKGWVRCGG